MEMQQHFLHEHPLKLVPVSVGSEDGDIERICAAGCHDTLSGHDQAYYACDPCGFYLHQSCGDLPQRIVEHPFHPCPLFLKLDRKPEGGGMGLSYRCEACQFEMDAASGSKKFQTGSSSEEEGHFLHISHPHPLMPFYAESSEEDAESSEEDVLPPSAEEEGEEEEVGLPRPKAWKDENLLQCKGCNLRISGKYYGCLSCGYYLDETCANAPLQIQHFYHPCTLSLELLDYKQCHACLEYKYNDFVYRCEECDFTMDNECTRFLPIGSDDKILNWSHHHPLELFEETEANGPRRWCDLCLKEIIIGQAYGACKPCDFDIHKTCMDLPREIQHRCHPCPIFLLKLTEYFPCNICLSSASRGFAYKCLKCKFTMDVECAIFSAASCTERGQAEHIVLHEHPLKLVPVGSEDGDIERICAAGCHDTLSSHDQAYYACDPCGFYLHQWCGDLPWKIQHPFHPCPLFLKLDRKPKGGGMGLSYRCEACQFEMDAASGSKFHASTSEVEGRLLHFFHPHPLMPFYAEEEGEEPSLGCQECNRRISGKYYGCLSCGYYLDWHCANWPLQIQHFYHPCTLSLELRGKYWRCDACSIYLNNMVYHCEECDFTMHLECARFLPIGSDDKILHWTHHHPLELFEAKGSRGCNLCGRKIIIGQAYGACRQKPCDFNIHKTCMDLPREIQHRCHPCPIFLLKHGNPAGLRCNICLSQPSPGFFYKCLKCRFAMDVECAIFSEASIESDQAEDILHFCHHHPLQLYKGPIQKTTTDIINSRKLECFVCGTPSSGLTYGCRECDIFLHKPCLEVLPQVLSIRNKPSVLFRDHQSCSKCSTWRSRFHFIDMTCHDACYCVSCALQEALSIQVTPSSVWIEHPNHPCSLILKYFAIFNCNACFTHCSTHAYYCGPCDFYVGLECAQLSTAVVEGGDGWIRHFCHWHPLQPSESASVSTASCRICGILCLQPSYFCSKCDFHVHKSCLDILHLKIDHHYFRCILVLLTTPSFQCILCQKDSDSGLAFRSIERGFKLCMECFFRPRSKLNDDGTFTSVHHWHHLSLIDNSEKDAYHCVLCGEDSPGVMYYYCKQCECHFHKDCTELPFEMQHPLHPQHPLTLISASQLPESRRSCSLCLREFPMADTPQSGIYHCKGCNFQLDRKCASTCIPSIRYQGDRHLLTVVEHMYGEEDCRVCSTTCIIGTCAFRCVECKFSLHLWCGPLPCDIKHPCHVHPLVLEDFYVEENYTDKFPCHICEEERNPMLPVYCCAQGCPMVCEIVCAISEVMPKLLGHHGGDVELRTTFPNEASQVIPICEIFEGMADVTHEDTKPGKLVYEEISSFIAEAGPYNFSDDESQTKYIVEPWEREMLKNPQEKDADYSFTKEAFSRFSSKLSCTQLTLRRDGIPEFVFQHGGDLTLTGEVYFLPTTLNPIYREFRKDLALDTVPRGLCRLSSSYLISILCAVLHDMRTTKVVEVTSDTVEQWLTLLKLLEMAGPAGYDVGIIVNKIKQVWDAHFLIKAKAIVDDTSDRLRKRHEQLSRKKEELLRELQDTEKEMEEVMEEEERHHRYAGNGMKSLRKEYAAALLIKWKPAISPISECTDQQLSDGSYSRLNGRQMVVIGSEGEMHLGEGSLRDDPSTQEVDP